MLKICNHVCGVLFVDVFNASQVTDALIMTLHVPQHLHAGAYNYNIQSKCLHVAGNVKLSQPKHVLQNTSCSLYSRY